MSIGGFIQPTHASTTPARTHAPRHAQVAEADVKVDRIVEQGVEAAHADEGRGPEPLQERVVHEVGRDERVLMWVGGVKGPGMLG